MRPEKQSMIDEIRRRLEEAEFVLLADYRGLSAEQMNALRSELRDLGAPISVVKNSYLRQGAAAARWLDMTALLDGPTAMICGRADVTEVVKRVRSFARTNALPVLKGGCVSGELLDSADVGRLADIPPRDVLLGKFVGTLAAPMSRMAGVLRQKLLSLVYVLKAVEEKKGGE